MLGLVVFSGTFFEPNLGMDGQRGFGKIEGVSANMVPQIERRMEHWLGFNGKPWGMVRTSKKWLKKIKLRSERRRAKSDPECAPYYRKYGGWDW